MERIWATGHSSFALFKSFLSFVETIRSVDSFIEVLPEVLFFALITILGNIAALLKLFQAILLK